MRATNIIWQGAGRPLPTEGECVPVPMRDPATLASVCAMCGEPGPRWTSDDAFSDPYRPLAHRSLLYPHVEVGRPVSLCAACTWCSRALRLRCAASFSRVDGVWFVSRRDLLAALLDPPEPPFVACVPLYGADHGGEANGWRALWHGEPKLPEGHDVLDRLQAKPVAVYAEIAYSRERYPLQWDDHTRVMVDVRLWRELAARLEVIAAALRSASVGVTDTREAITKLRCPMRAPVSVHGRWPAMIRGLETHARAPWWPLLADLLPLPDAPPKPEKNVKAAKAADAPAGAAAIVARAAEAPSATDTKPNPAPPVKGPKAQLSLF